MILRNTSQLALMAAVCIVPMAASAQTAAPSSQSPIAASAQDGSTVLVEQIGPPPIVSRTDALSLADITAHLDKVRSYIAPDAFTKQMDQSQIVGQRVVIRRKLGAPDRSGTGWTYDAEKQVINIDIGVHAVPAIEGMFKRLPINGGGWGRVPSTIEIAEVDDGEKRDTEGNAFGATVEVVNWYKRIYAVMAVRTGNDIAPAKKSDTFRVWFPVRPEIARASSSKLELVIEGVVTPMKDGSVAECGIDSSDATFSMPYTFTNTYCVLPLHLDRVAIEMENRAIVSEWRVKP